MKTTIYVISDIEIGGGDFFDDFADEQSLIGFINMLSKKVGKKILVLNGDTYDLLKMPYKGVFTHHITEEMSLWKMQQIIKNHPKIFQALRNFVKKNNNRIHFNIGNHDYELVWTRLQNLLKKELGPPKNITFAHKFDRKDLHIEHGNQLDFTFMSNIDKPFIFYKNQKLLNIPYGNMLVINYFIDIKKLFPKEEKIHPRAHAFSYNPEFKKTSSKIGFRAFMNTILLNIFVDIRDPLMRAPVLNTLKHIRHYGFNFYNEKKFMLKRLKMMRKKNPDKKVYVMGHVHLFHHEVNHKKHFINIVTDTWREEFNVNTEKETILKPKTYAKIVYNNGDIEKVDLLTYHKNEN